MTTSILLIQLPVPQLNFGRQTGNIPLGAACLKQASAGVKDVRISILPQKTASYLGDAALVNLILRDQPDIVGFTTYAWNVQRTLHMTRCIKNAYDPRTILGGPEVTPDNPLVHDDSIDDYVYGEGEWQFVQLLLHREGAMGPTGYRCQDDDFSNLASPYLHIDLDHQLEGTMLLETMRGCPYHCAYCYYNKSHGKPSFKPNHLVLTGIQWALSNNISEIYLLDPSLNSRPDLKGLLKQIAVINKDHKLSLISEIRAEAIDEELADLFHAAGFSWFEIGLQSANPAALEFMRRNTRPDRFLKGVNALKKRGIAAAVDLIVGLPGDDFKGFANSVRFVADHELQDDIQVFPLSLLPGTEFRQRYRELGLEFEKTPPYTIISTPTFCQEDILLAFDHAETRFDISLYPLPDLDIAWQTGKVTDIRGADNIQVTIGQEELLYKIFLENTQSEEQWRTAAQKVSHPYQLFIPPDMTDFKKIRNALTVFTQTNPCTPLEIIFFSPRVLPDVDGLLKGAKLDRPHYLDGDLRPLYREPGNRAILFTVVSTDHAAGFSGPMQRHIFWWRHSILPDADQLSDLETAGFGGILIDTPTPEKDLCDWQDAMSPVQKDLILVDFASIRLHKRWIQKTASEDYCLQLLP